MSSPYDTLCIDHTPFETRAALLKAGKLVQLHINRSTQPNTAAPVQTGDICRGRIVNIVPSLQACFVDIGQGQNGFLPVNASLHDDIKGHHQGEILLVQIKQPAKGDKGPVLSAKIELNGANCVHTPHRPGINISRKFKDANKRELFKTALNEQLPHSCGLVVRTHAESASPQSIAEEALQLVKQWQSLITMTDKSLGLVCAGEDFLTRLWDSLATKQLHHVYVEGLEAAHQLQQVTDQALLYNNQPNLFEKFDIESQIEAALSPIVALPTGGHVVIEETQALIAIDINMAERTDTRNLEENRLRTNIEALDVIKEQLVLRNLSGQILVDFINLKNRQDRHKLEEEAKRLFKDQDCHFHGLTRLGLGEFSRPHLSHSLTELYSSSQMSYAQVIKKLQAGGLARTIAMGERLHGFWQKNPPNWLEDRLGFMPKAQLDKSLPLDDYCLKENNT